MLINSYKFMPTKIHAYTFILQNCCLKVPQNPFQSLRFSTQSISMAFRTKSYCTNRTAGDGVSPLTKFFFHVATILPWLLRMCRHAGAATRVVETIKMPVTLPSLQVDLIHFHKLRGVTPTAGSSNCAKKCHL